jgi:hypothetical protein
MRRPHHLSRRLRPLQMFRMQCRFLMHLHYRHYRLSRLFLR